MDQISSCDFIYCGRLIEDGRNITGANAVTTQELAAAEHVGVNLLYGEIQPMGIDSILTHEIILPMLEKKETTFVDAGMGIGKVCASLFVPDNGVNKIIGVEFCKSRYVFAYSTAMLLKNYMELDEKSATFTKTNTTDSMEYKLGNFMDIDPDILKTTDILLFNIAQTKEAPFNEDGKLLSLLSNLPKNSVIISYHAFDANSFHTILTLVDIIDCCVSYRVKVNGGCDSFYMYQRI